MITESFISTLTNKYLKNKFGLKTFYVVQRLSPAAEGRKNKLKIKLKSGIITVKHFNFSKMDIFEIGSQYNTERKKTHFSLTSTLSEEVRNTS